VSLRVVSQSQAAILAPLFPHGRFLVLGLQPGADARRALDRVRELRVTERSVLGVGAPLVPSSDAIPGLRPFPALSRAGVAYPSTQGALFAFLGGTDPGELLHEGRALVAALGESFRLDEDVQAFQYAGGRDLSGYEDGTENPKGEAAMRAAIVAGKGPGLDGGSFVAAQRWVHDLDRLDGMTAAQRDEAVGRRRDTNEEMADAPPSAHVKRAAQESYDPPAFMVRRSMPYGTVREHGLFFVAYGATLDAFERVLRRMAGLEDGVHDGLSTFTRAVSGGYYFCPPVTRDRLDLSIVG
jgi:putative iron-dependent peroxidase